MQVKAEKTEKAGRKQLVSIREMYERLEGKNSAGWLEANEAILNMDDLKVKRRVGKFRENSLKITTKNRQRFSLG